MKNDLIGFSEAAKLTGFTESQLRDQVRRGCIPYLAVSLHLVRFDRHLLLEWRENRSTSRQRTKGTR